MRRWCGSAIQRNVVVYRAGHSGRRCVSPAVVVLVKTLVENQGAVDASGSVPNRELQSLFLRGNAVHRLHRRCRHYAARAQETRRPAVLRVLHSRCSSPFGPYRWTAFFPDRSLVLGQHIQLQHRRDGLLRGASLRPAGDLARCEVDEDTYRRCSGCDRAGPPAVHCDRQDRLLPKRLLLRKALRVALGGDFPGDRSPCASRTDLRAYTGPPGLRILVMGQEVPEERLGPLPPVSYTHLTLPTIYSV